MTWFSNKRCDGLSTDLQSAHDSGQNWAWCDFAANDYKTINVSAVWRTDSCGDSNLQTIPAQIVIESDYARAKLQLHFCLLINIHWSNELCHATPTVAATLFGAMHWVKIINVSMKVQFTVKSVMFTMFPPCECPMSHCARVPATWELNPQSIFTKRFKFGPVVRRRN